MGLGGVADLVGCLMENPDIVLGEGPLDLVRGAAQVRECYQRTLGIKDIQVVSCSGDLALDLPSRVAVPQ